MKSCSLRIMSHNLWKNDANKPAWEEKGLDCSADARVKGFIKVYEELSPDIIGCQEMSSLMAEKLMCGVLENGQKYALLWGKDTPIIYRTDKFEIIDSHFALYPEELPGYEGCFNNYKTKSWNIAVFRIKENGKHLIFATNHLWWKSSQPTNPNYQPYSDLARVYQIGLIITKIEEYRKKYDCPAIIVGDLNGGYNSQCVKTALEKGYVHAHDVSIAPPDESAGLHYCFADGYYDYYYDFPFEKAIDHILLTPESELKICSFNRYSPKYYLPLSDHSPVYCDIEI